MAGKRLNVTGIMRGVVNGRGIGKADREQHGGRKGQGDQTGGAEFADFGKGMGSRLYLRVHIIFSCVISPDDVEG